MQRVEERDIAARNIGRYVLFREIAHGGMATVHLARMRGLAGFARTVAIKRLHPPFARDPEFVSMLLDEARLAARIQHPNVVPVLDVVASEGELFLVMEYVHGESFSKLLRCSREMAHEERLPLVIGVAVQILHGLHAAHEARSERGDPLDIVHRDVSPQNVLVGADGVARVLDFGIAKAAQRIHSETRAGQIKGKLRYMAPEQVAAGPVDRRADIYAAGVMLWEAVTGEQLFTERDTVKLIAEILTREHDAPSTRRPEISKELDAIVMRSLARDPEDRLPTARDLAVALEQAVPLSSQREIGEWVARIAAGPLRARAMSVAEMEERTHTTNTAPPISAIPSLTDESSAASSSQQHETPTVKPPKPSSGDAAGDEALPLLWPARLRARNWLLIAVGIAAVVLPTVALAKVWEERARAVVAPLQSRPIAESVRLLRTSNRGMAATKDLRVPPPPPPAPPPTTPVTIPPPTPRASPTQSRLSTAAPSPPPRAGCNPPYTIDATGVRIPKRWCR